MKHIGYIKLLPTDKNYDSLYSYKGRRLNYRLANFNDEDETLYYHLYIFSDNEINVGDWMINPMLNKIELCTEDNSPCIHYKIELTTNRKLGLPIIDDDYIEYIYIESYNKQIEINQVVIDYDNETGKYKIYPLKDKFTRSEVILLMQKYGDHVCSTVLSSLKLKYPSSVNFINKIIELE